MRNSFASDAPDALLLELSHIREELIRQEDTIIFALIERSQFKRNAACYDPDHAAYRDLAGADSFLDYMLLETERLHARVCRYASPDEHAFFPHRLPPPQLPLRDLTAVLKPCVVNLNADIMDLYLRKVLPSLCRPGDDEQHGSSVVRDVTLLQAISKRVHYGLFVAESKFRAQEETYRALILAEDEAGIMELLTNSAVEAKVLRRVHRKACTFAQEVEVDAAEPAPAAGSSALRVDPDAVVAMYRDYVIPLTKVAEVQYLLQRLGNISVAVHGPAGSASHRAALRRFAGSAGPPDRPLSLTACASVKEVFAAVMCNQAYQGVVLLDEGDGGISRDLLAEIATSPLAIVGELVELTRFRLVSASPLAAITVVRGRPRALRACTSWLRDHFQHAVEFEATGDEGPTGREAAADGADATVADGAAAAPVGVAFLEPAEAGGARPDEQVLLRPPDSCCTRSRYVVLSKPRAYGRAPSGADRSFLLFTLKDEAGSLAAALASLERHRVNLAAIHSYSEAEGCSTIFCEVDGHELDGHVAAALAELRRSDAALKVIGGYARKKPDGLSPASPRSVN